MPLKCHRVDGSSSQNPASKSYSPSGQWKGRGICISPEGPTLAQVDAERARLEGVIDKLKARLTRIDGVLATLSRRRRKFVLVVRRTHGVRVVLVLTYDVPLKKFQAKSNRATRYFQLPKPSIE